MLRSVSSRAFFFSSSPPASPSLSHWQPVSRAVKRQSPAYAASQSPSRSAPFLRRFASAAPVKSRSSESQYSSFAAGCLLVTSFVFLLSTSDYERLDSWRTIAPADEYLNPDMPNELAPGRLGNLTIDEQLKLQEGWRRLSKICNVPLDDDEEEADDTSAKAANAAPEKEPEKSKRPRFRRKRSDIVKTDKTAEDDKYGQTKEFQQALKENTPEDIRVTVWRMVKMDHPDALILRFLRARKWDIDKALVMMISTMNWRKRDMKIEDTIVLEGEAVTFKEHMNKDDEGFMAQYRMGKSFVHGVDKEGRPMCIIRARLHHPGSHTLKSLEDYTVHTIETARMTLRDPVDTATLIFDMTDFSLRNMDNAPVRFMIKCFEANYPESLGLVTVHKAPWVFQGIWKLVRGWLDPVVAAKIHFTNTVEDLEQFINKENILKEFGGGDDWEYKYQEPTADENEKMKDTATRDKLIEERRALVKEFEDKTKKWLKYAPTEPEYTTLTKERNDLAEKLRVQYWQLDPYIRARTLYDRTGVISEGGKIDFYPYRSSNKAE